MRVRDDVPVEPHFDLSVQIAGRGKGHLFPVLGPHRRGFFDRRSALFG